MNINDKDALQYASRIILILVPFFSSLFDTWSWIVEILLLLAVFIHSRGSGLRSTILFLALGYLSSIIPAGGQALINIGLTPWTGIMFLALKEKGIATFHSMFWSLMFAATISALPVIPTVSAALQPDNLQDKIRGALNFYEQQGTLTALEKQGMTSAEFEGYLRIAMPIYYKLLPAISGIIGMMELGIAYLVFRLSQKNTKNILFTMWSLPWYAVWVAIIGLASYLGGEYLGFEILAITGLNLMVIMGAISIIIGFSCLSFLFRHPKIPRVFIWLIVFAGVFFPYFVLVGLIFIGLFDLVINFRKIPEKLEEGKQ